RGPVAGRLAAFALLGCSIAAPAAMAQECPVSHDQLTKALKASVKPSGGPTNGGFDNNEWAVVVDRDGAVCAVAMSGGKPGDQWLASRAIAAEKANTANSMSLPQMAISTANLYAGSLPAGYLYGALATNPPVPDLLYAGDPHSFGTASDPWLGKHLGGVVVFGGGLALYGDQGIVGALGVSGDTSCADHNVAWRVRQGLGLDRVPNGISPAHNDAIVYDMLPDKTSASGYGHPQCGGSEPQIAEQIHAGFIPQWAQVTKK
ncbi:MAG: heme-binding protein, partial [Alphaproteobacteria bacterium]